jgi:hypothetical protein
MVFVKFAGGMKKYGKRFLIGWLVSSVGMFGVSYLWHGFFLNDYQRMNFPMAIYLVAASITYLVIGFLVSRVFIIEYFDKISRHPLLRGPAVGFTCGMVVYIVAMAIQASNASGYGSIVTFNKEFDAKYMVLDLTWQGIEQAFGGLIIGLVYMFVFEPVFIPEED